MSVDLNSIDDHTRFEFGSIQLTMYDIDYKIKR